MVLTTAEGTVVVLSFILGEVEALLVVVAMIVVPSLVVAVVLDRPVVPAVVLILISEAVVGDVGTGVVAVEVSPGVVVADALVVLPAVVLEVVAVFVADVGTVYLEVMMVLPCVGRAVVPTVVVIFFCGSVRTAVGVATGCVATLVVSAGESVVEVITVVPVGATVV